MMRDAFESPDDVGISFIITRNGVSLFYISILFSSFGYFGVLDLTPPVFSQTSLRPAGVYVAPPSGFLPSSVTVYGFLDMLLVPLVFMIPLFVGVKNNDADEWASGIRFWVLVIVTGSYLLAIILVFISVAPGIGNTRSGLDYPLGFWLFTVVYVFLSGVMSATYIQPSLPERFDDFDEKSKDRYLETQWRFGRLILTLMIAVIVGITVPFAIQMQDSVPVFGLLFLWSSLGSPLGSVALFYILRAHRVERKMRTLNRDSSSDPWR